MRIPHLIEAKNHGRKLTMLTAYDAITASILDSAGLDMLLVGDSIGTTMFGLPTTIPVELDEMVVATRAVARGTKRAIVVADLPFGTYEASPEQCFNSAARLMKAGAAAVKFEGGKPVAEQVTMCATHGIPVVGHLGFTPQSEHALGGPRIQGRTDDAADRLVEDAVALEEAGAVAIVLEMVPAHVAQRVTEVLAIPTIGIGAGVHCDGQVLVWSDMAGMQDWIPSFAKRFGEVGEALRATAQAFVDEVHAEHFPTRDHSF